jgi:hypothetical protein
MGKDNIVGVSLRISLLPHPQYISVYFLSHRLVFEIRAHKSTRRIINPSLLPMLPPLPAPHPMAPTSSTRRLVRRRPASWS